MAIALSLFTGLKFGLVAAGLVAMALALAVGLFAFRRQRSIAREVRAKGNDPSPADASGASDSKGLAVDHADELFRLMVSQHRAALLLRPQVAENLTDPQIVEARESLERDMALVPGGVVKLKQPRELDVENDHFDGITLNVDPVRLDRYPVTNAQFHQFVQAGGYDESALWDREMLMGVLEFVDQTGHSGPKFWRDGNPLPGTDDHPVVGVSWFEANAYARWVGKRLPTDAEWVKAGSWPVGLPGSEPVQRKYPWGNNWEAGHANIWGSGPGTTTPIHQFEDGASVSGVYGLVGNVWEWTADFFGSWHGPGHSDLLAIGMKSLRGGAFDTYFEKQANCHFQSGDLPAERKHNIGFRCAVGVCDLVELPRACVDDHQSNAHPVDVLVEAAV